MNLRSMGLEAEKGLLLSVVLINLLTGNDAFIYYGGSEENSGAAQANQKTPPDVPRMATPSTPTGNNNPMVAFSATRSSPQDGAFQHHSTINFQHVNINLGNGFNPTTGVFTCEVPGLYMITFSAAANLGRKLNLDLVKVNPGQQETVMAGLLKTKTSSKHIEVLSRSVIVPLEKGDVLYLRQAAGINNGVYSDWEQQTSFAGFLVYAGSFPSFQGKQTYRNSTKGYRTGDKSTQVNNSRKTKSNFSSQQKSKLELPQTKPQENMKIQKEEGRGRYFHSEDMKGTRGYMGDL